MGSVDHGLSLCWITRGDPDSWMTTVVDDQSPYEFSHWPYGGNATQLLADVVTRAVRIPPLTG